jgi:toxin FitB
LNYLLDTNVISEPMKARPDAKVVRWLAAADEDCLFLSVISFAEIRKGIEELGLGRRRDTLTAWLYEELAVRFERRILAVDLGVTEAWGTIMSRTSRMGLNLGAMDAFFAATADVHDLTFVTRNAKDFEKLDIPLLNPWKVIS